MPLSKESILDAIVEISRQAGDVILEVYSGQIDVRQKEDASPVTEADERAEALILPALQKLTPEIPIVAEEAVAAGNLPDTSGGTFWLVDPLDGTKEFISRNGEFTVNIALIENGSPVLGVVHAPAIGQTFSGIVGSGAFLQEDGEQTQEIHVRHADEAGLTIVASRSHGKGAELDDFLKNIKVRDFREAGSSLKFCLVAAGQADLYPRFGRTMEWDTAAGDAVLRAAGGSVVTTEGNPLSYGKDVLDNPHFIARSHP